ncbi:MAG: hypothetical protein KYQ20_01740 [Candidatus Nealsonbacteria bacterium]|nr:hypothetical protein [Candidatus Nealsonbacteria bacterium]
MVNNSEKGLALYLTFVVLVVVLASVLGVSVIFLRQIAAIERLEDSVIAFLAADTGIERELDSTHAPPEDYTGTLDLGGGLFSRYNVRVASTSPECPAPNFCIRSVGTFKEVRRAIEVRR